jgi:hypothetical protein
MEKIINDLRELYRQKDLIGMKKEYALGMWLIPKEKRGQIEQAILNLEIEKGKDDYENDLVSHAVKNYKYKVVKEI